MNMIHKFSLIDIIRYNMFNNGNYIYIEHGIIYSETDMPIYSYRPFVCMMKVFYKKNIDNFTPIK